MSHRRQTKKRESRACLIVKIERPSGTTDDLLSIYLGERAEQPEPFEAEFPRTPERVNGLYCAYGEMGLLIWSSSINLEREPAYRRASFVDGTDAKAMLSTIRHLSRKLAKLTTARGYPTSLGERVARFAEVTDARWLAFDQDPWRRALPAEPLRTPWHFTEIACGRMLIDLLATSLVPARAALPARHT